MISCKLKKVNKKNLKLLLGLFIVILASAFFTIETWQQDFVNSAAGHQEYECERIVTNHNFLASKSERKSKRNTAKEECFKPFFLPPRLSIDKFSQYHHRLEKNFCYALIFLCCVIKRQ